MSRRSAEAEENHWPGFVDALSTIVMVVTFLLIILAVVIAVLAQNVSKNHFAHENKEKNLDGMQTVSTSQVENTAKEIARIAPETQSTPVDSQQASSTPVQPSEPTKSDNKFKSEKSESLKSEDTIDGNTQLSVLSEKVSQKEERIEIEKAQPQEKPKVKTVETSDTVLTLAFDAAGIKIDEESAEKINNFLAKNTELTSEHSVAIWSFGDANSTSISEQKRIIYYRALAARNELLKNNFDKDKIKVEVRFSPDPKLINTVRIMKN